MTTPIQLHEVRKSYGSGPAAVTALAGLSIAFPAGSFTAVMGPSGSGKSTLLHCAAGLDEPTSGTVSLVGRSLAGMSENDLTLLRRDHVAFVFQAFNLMPALTVRENVMLPALLAGRRSDPARVSEVIRRVGLEERATHRPGELSGGQQQRVAIARALASDASVLFADEPTGALDSHTAAEVLTLIRDLADKGQTIVMVTHDPVAASYADNVVFLLDGRFVAEIATPTAAEVAERLAHLGSLAGNSASRGQR
ncbi:putative ABC transport system ATP-binding protein [Nonomuraea solani]|uniref:Putative ABC transport system ATP-binding protein n=1 Tax=Nonomuraea solani TaxID=1144553 RepID=A0A1H6EGT1_9ACTN|nr:ABC transporter ATP-binding protein [Nonomuraea solani]SEG96166.1 putative ABC transport system ATP-binding protein [Nonomuraea solani]